MTQLFINERAVDPPPSSAPWTRRNNTNALGQGGARTGDLHMPIPAFVGGVVISPLQRMGLAPMNAIGVLPPDANEVPTGVGERTPVLKSFLFDPVLRMIRNGR